VGQSSRLAKHHSQNNFISALQAQRNNTLQDHPDQWETVDTKKPALADTGRAFL